MLEEAYIIKSHLKILYAFRNNQLLIQALTHKSCGANNNERLEFLGDGVLNCIIAEELFYHQNQFDECQLTRLRAKLVCKDALIEVGNKIGVNKCIKLSGSELKTGGRKRKSILANAVEAIIGAAFIDGGYAAAKELVLELYSDYFADLPKPEDLIDPKTKLQEYMQAQKFDLPVYQLINSSGPGHNKKFTVLCTIEYPKSLGKMAKDTTRQKAEQKAAAKILQLI